MRVPIPLYRIKTNRRHKSKNRSVLLHHNTQLRRDKYLAKLNVHFVTFPDPIWKGTRTSMSSPAQSLTLSLNASSRKNELIGFGTISAVLSLVVLFIPNGIVGAIAGILLVCTGSMFLMLSATFTASKLDGLPKTIFQIAIAVSVPSILSLYFLVGTTSVQHVFSNMMRLSILLPLAIIAYFSWIGADHLNRKTPVTGFLFGAGILFVICFVFHNGAVVEYADDLSDDGSSSSFRLDPEQAPRNRASGEYFGLYSVYVGVAYTAMLIKMRRQQIV